MRGNHNHINKYSADDIPRYLEGGMSAVEMHAMEKAALDDPFLADAIEGYALANDAQKQEAMFASRQQLDREFAARISKNKKAGARVVGFRRWQTAAAAVIIISAAALGYLAYDDKAESTMLSQTEKVVREESSPMVAADTSTGSSAAPETDAIEPAAATMKVRDPETKSKAKLETTPQTTADTKQETRPVREEPKAEKALRNPAPTSAAGETLAYQPAIAERTMIDSSPPQQKLVQELQGRVAGVAITKNQRNEQAVNNKYFNGQLLTPDNRPLSNAVINVSNDQKQYLTDNNGYFTIPSSDSAVVVDIALIGQQPQRFTLSQNPALNKLIIPGQAPELSEVVVVGYGAKRKTTKTQTTANAMNAEPVGGWEAFNKYIAANKPDSLLNIPPITTAITFSVSGKNKLSDFRITNSISPSHDDAAIRLIRQGPAWKVIKGRKATVTIEIGF